MLYGALTEGSIWPGVMTVLCAAFLLVGVNSYEAVVKG
jgi:hypothetical protein